LELINALVSAWQLPDLRRKLLFTAFLLAVFRFIAHVPVPGADAEALTRLFQTNQLVGLLDLFSGGAMSTFSIAAMGVYPYITASIIMQLLVPIIPQLTELTKEGESGRNKINQYTHWLTVPLAALQAWGTPNLLNASAPQPIIKDFGFGVNPLGTLAIIITMTAGTVLLIWIGELITQYGIGNGISIIIFGGIVARLPPYVGQAIAGGSGLFTLLLFALLAVVTVAAIVYVYEGVRRIPVQVAKRIRGNRMYGGQTTHIPLKVNSAGMIPLIFAQSILLFPSVVAGYFLGVQNETVRTIANWIYTTFQAGTSPVYWVLYFLMVVGFTFFYTLVIFQQQNIAENLQKQGGFVPGIRPGRPTAEYLLKVLTRITLAGALFLGIVAVLPVIARAITGVQALTLSATAFLIVVGVALDTMRQLEAQLLMRNYRGFIR
jgi:preprotein translocase subunit SecY